MKTRNLFLHNHVLPKDNLGKGVVYLFKCSEYHSAYDIAKPANIFALKRVKI